MKKFSIILLSGTFLGLVASQSLMDLFLALSTLLGLYLLWLNKQRGQLLPLPRWMLLAIPWFLWVMVGLLVHNQDGSVIQKGLGDFIWLAQLPLFVYLWREADTEQRIAKIFLFILLLTGIYAVFIYFLGFDPLQQSWIDREQNLSGLWRTGGLFSNAMALAQSYGPLAVLLLPLGLYSLRQQNSFRNWLVLTGGVTFLTVLLTFTRGVWIGVCLATIIGGFIYNKRWGWRTLSLALLCGGILMGAWPKFRERTLQAFDTQKSYDSERLVLWKTNWYIFKENPILGIGYGENKRRLRSFYDQLGVPADQFEGHAHNQYLHFLAGTGIVGLAFYLLWCSLFLRITLNLYEYFKRQKQIEYSLLCLGVLMAQAAFHIGSLTESNFTISKNRMLLVFLWSYVLFLNSKKSSENEATRL